MAKHRNEDGKSEGDSRYDEELLSANWNPVIDLLQSSCARTLDDVKRSAAQELREEDADAFLGRIYSLGS